MEMKELLEDYGCLTFSDHVMKERIPKSTYKAFHESLDKGEALSRETATIIANAMKLWAIELGATHFTHWFTPMTGLTAEKHDAFLEPEGSKATLEFSGKTLRKGEPDASSFPSGGLRATFEARGYTAWDCTSPAFVKDGTLYIPTLFCSYTGEALDKKTPLLRSVDALSKSAVNLLPLIGVEGVTKVSASVGAEQEYFLVDDRFYQKRMDLRLAGRTLYGALAPKGQELDDHYFGSIKRKVGSFMRELDDTLWKYGIPSKTKHNEAAPAQHEVACVYTKANITCDNNHLLMMLAKDIAKKHGLRCLLHEKPFAGVNGSGKHNNWSITTNTGINLFDPGDNPANNLPFLAMLACTIKGIDEYAELLRMSAASAGNDHRLGANEAPPAIMSIFLGEDLENIVNSIINDVEVTNNSMDRFETGVSVVPTFSKDTTDRNRTSPFAFTGNKFEFRAVGASQSIAGPNTILNTILAEEMDQMAAAIENGETPMAVIKRFFKDHQRIIFNGDGYSKEWEEEAKRRGLPNKKNTVDALDCLLNEDFIEMFARHDVYSKIELESRYDILMNGYIKIIQVEALTMLKMARNELYPAVSRYINKQAETAKHLEDIGIANDFMKEEVGDLARYASWMYNEMQYLDKAISYAKSIPDNHLKLKASRYRDDVLVSMNRLRETADRLETLVDSAEWPIPDYVDLMFGI
ncbi:MAG: glutamine synthetase III [Erysipelotrichaceae bacterium]|nr:glutamine synthetase III [Erysipelotrichaceae bacterium]